MTKLTGKQIMDTYGPESTRKVVPGNIAIDNNTEYGVNIIGNFIMIYCDGIRIYLCRFKDKTPREDK